MSRIKQDAKYIYVDDSRPHLWDDADWSKWRYISPNFAPMELDSDDFTVKLTTDSLQALNRMRERYGRPIRVTNAYRNPSHNARVGGKPNSQHLAGTAYDIVVKSRSEAEALERLAIDEGFTAIGRYPRSRFMHIDMRPPKPSGKLYRWGQGWERW